MPALTGASEQVFDMMVSHQIELLQYSTGVRNDINKLLNAADEDLKRIIQGKLAKVAGTGLTPASVKRLQALERYLKTVRTKTFNEITARWVGELQRLAQVEAVVTKGILETAAPTLVQFALPSPALLKALVTSKPMQGQVLGEWAKSLAKSDQNRIMAQLRIGMVQGESMAQLTGRVFGTTSSAGITAITRANAEAITRTAVMTVSNDARDEFYGENADLFEGERFTATLDSRTTPQCRALDGKVYPVGEGPRPPLHWQCRSLRIPNFSGLVATRPAKAYTEKMLLKEFKEKNGLKGTINSRDDLPRGYKGAFDKYSRQRAWELTTTVPSTTNYNDWLFKQTNAFQDEVLGSSKAALFRTGQITLDKFVDASGRSISLVELAGKYTDIFKAAGLGEPHTTALSSGLATSIKMTTEQVAKVAKQVKQASESFKEFVASTVKTFSTTVDYLLDSEKWAVKAYSGHEYREINSFMRGEKMSEAAKKRVVETAVQLDRAIDKAKFNENVVLFRKVSTYSGAPAGWVQEMRGLKVGQVFEEKGYVSTSLLKSNWSGDIQFVIRASKGQRGLYMNAKIGGSGSLSRYPSEQEVLLPRGSKFRVLSVKDVSGSKIIEVELLS